MTAQVDARCVGVHDPGVAEAEPPVLAEEHDWSCWTGDCVSSVTEGPHSAGHACRDNLPAIMAFVYAVPAAPRMAMLRWPGCLCADDRAQSLFCICCNRGQTVPAHDIALPLVRASLPGIRPSGVPAPPPRSSRPGATRPDRIRPWSRALVEKWRVGTIAGQLHVHQSASARVTTL
jgi:hypothetical protein